MTLESMENRNHDKKVQLDKFSKYQGTYAAYILVDNQGTRVYHGSACSEQNNSSLLVHLNDGHGRESRYWKDTHILVKDLLQREQKKVNKWNNLLHDQKMQIYVRMEKFNYITPQWTHDASTVLSAKIFNFWKYCSKDSWLSSGINFCFKCQSQIQIPYHCSNAKLLQEIPKLFFSCVLCEVSCAYEHPCVHYLATNGGKFFMIQFNIRHLIRDFVSGFCLSKNNTEVAEKPS